MSNLSIKSLSALDSRVPKYLVTQFFYKCPPAPVHVSVKELSKYYYSTFYIVVIYKESREGIVVCKFTAVFTRVELQHTLKEEGVVLYAVIQCK